VPRSGIYIQLDCYFADDPDVSRLNRYGADTRGIRDLFVQMICYCKSTLSDGPYPVRAGRQAGLPGFAG
jgi:hypothetical protein